MAGKIKFSQVELSKGAEEKLKSMLKMYFDKECCITNNVDSYIIKLKGETVQTGIDADGNLLYEDDMMSDISFKQLLMDWMGLVNVIGTDGKTKTAKKYVISG